MAKFSLKSYARRDSATSLLRKHGIDKSEYPHYISGPHADGSVEICVDETGNPQPIKKMRDFEETKPKAKAKPVKETVKAETKPAGEKKESLSAAVRRLITEGKSNEEIRDILELTPEQKHYPTWYRCEMRRNGKDV